MNSAWPYAGERRTARRRRSCSIAWVLAATGCAAVLPLSAAQAHCFVGDFFLPATLTIDDPCVADELSLPTLSWMKSGDGSLTRELDVSGDISKRITENLGITIGTDWSRVFQPGAPRTSGFQNFETDLQYQVLKDAADELAISAEINVEWGGTGAKALGTDAFTTIGPSVQFGKGMGGLPDTMGWVRPFALTGQVGYTVATSSSTTSIDPDTGFLSSSRNPDFLTYGATLQYNMPYLKSSVVDLGLPSFVNHLIPLVEAQFATPVANNAGTGIKTTGTINPGVIWIGKYNQVALEAVLPINHDSGRGVGIMLQFHLYLDDLFPHAIGQPLFGPNTSTTKPAYWN
jgi:hypothetical protein